MLVPHLCPYMNFRFSVFLYYRDLLAKAESSRNSVYSLLEAQDADGHTALHLACRRGSVEVVETILEYKEADVNILDKDGEPPIVFALAAGSPGCVRALISRSANVSYRLREGGGPSIAHYCALHGQPDCMRVSCHKFPPSFVVNAIICSFLTAVLDDHRSY